MIISGACLPLGYCLFGFGVGVGFQGRNQYQTLIIAEGTSFILPGKDTKKIDSLSTIY